MCFFRVSFHNRFKMPKMDFERILIVENCFSDCEPKVGEVLKDCNEQNLNVSSVRSAFI